MHSNTNDDIDALNHVTKILIDGSALYEEAGKLSDDDKLASEAIKGLAAERRSLCSDFQSKVQALGGEAADDGTVTGAAHQGFMGLRSLVQSDSKTAVAEVERGEDYLRNEIKKSLQKKELSDDVQVFLRDALTRIRSGHDRISALKHAQ